MRPAQDRGGGREGKKSLRVGKKALVEAAKKYETEQKNALKQQRPQYSLAPHHLTPLDGRVASRVFDCSFFALNRNFEHDSQTIIERARDAGVQGMVVVCNDFGKSKELCTLAAHWAGTMYCMVGLHPDNIKRVHNITQFNEQMETLLDHALSREAVALYAGFDLSRDASTHHLQEKLFDAHLQMARKIRLPLVVRICDATDKLIEVLENQGSSESAPATSSSSVFASGEQPSAAVKLCVFGCTPASCCLAQLQKLLAFDCSIAVDAAFTHESAGWSEFLRAIPDNRLMLASDAPHHTPQNIEDEWIRKQRNEPSNLPYTVKALATVRETTVKALSDAFFNNAISFFGISDNAESDDESDSEATAPAEPKTQGIVGLQYRRAGASSIPNAGAHAAKGKNEKKMDSNVADELETELDQLHFGAESKGKSAKPTKVQPKVDSDSEQDAPAMKQSKQKKKKGKAKYDESDSDDMLPRRAGKGKISESEEDEELVGMKKSNKQKGKNKKKSRDADEPEPVKASKPAADQKAKKGGSKRRDDSDSADDELAMGGLVIDEREVAAALLAEQRKTTSTQADSAPTRLRFSCGGCKRLLFFNGHIVSHCDSTDQCDQYFLSADYANEDSDDECDAAPAKPASVSSLPPLPFRLLQHVSAEQTLHCPQCEEQLGEFVAVNAPSIECACGHTPAASQSWFVIDSQQVSLSVSTVASSSGQHGSVLASTLEALKREALELQALDREAAESAEREQALRAQAKKDGKRKKVVSSGRSNLSNYRNKDTKSALYNLHKSV